MAAAQARRASDDEDVREFVRLIGREPSPRELAIYREVVAGSRARRRSQRSLRREIARLIARF